MADPRKGPKIEFVRPPPIKVYSVSGDQLDRISEACSEVGHDLSFSLTAFGVGISLAVTVFTTPMSDKQQSVFVMVMILSLVVFLYTGIRWIRTRSKATSIIDSIRRSDEPENGEAEGQPEKD